MKIEEILFKKENTNNLKIIRLIEENDTTVVHYLVDDMVAFVVIKNNSIIESIKTKYLGVNPLNGRTQINGFIEIKDLDKTESNKNHVLNFIKEVILKGASNNKDKMANYINDSKYFQHNVDNGIGDGLDQLKKSIDKMITYDSDLQYDEVDIVVAQGNFVFTKSIQHWLNPKTNLIEDWEYFDLFRVEDDLIVEHWDILGKIK